jgi:hypothetical protein
VIERRDARHAQEDTFVFEQLRQGGAGAVAIAHIDGDEIGRRRQGLEAEAFGESSVIASAFADLPRDIGDKGLIAE